MPSPYVKIYLLPDPDKLTKRKTKIVKLTTHPTYNEVVSINILLTLLRLAMLSYCHCFVSVPVTKP
jgi:phosphatidylinositol-4-phosphate 3-kinase